MPVNPQRAIANLRELQSLTSDASGAQRLAWSPTWLKARAWFQDKLKNLPVEHHYDAAGNSWTTLRGKSEQSLILGSHLDSVPNGGWLDGCLGVLAALEVMQTTSEETGGNPDLTIRLVDWADEEGARFGRSLFGSSAFAGTHTIEADRQRTDRDGIKLEDALRDCSIFIDRISDAAIERGRAGAYLELHIEQGPILESMKIPVGSVLGTKGVERHTITFHGQEAHSGSTPMRVRRDALAAAAKLALAIRAIAGKHPDAVATMGSVKTFPGIVTAVVGRCETTLDMRDLDARILATMLAEAREASERFASEEGCSVAWSKIWSIDPIPFHPQLIHLCQEAVVEVTGVFHSMPSGPLHDAAEVSRSGIPTAMMFVQSLAGLSHNAAEDSSVPDLEAAIQSYYLFARKTMEWLQQQPNS